MSSLLSKLFDGVITQTTLAHRLLAKAWHLGGQAKQLPLLEGLFKAYFEEGKNVGDIQVLAEVAASAGLLSEEEVSTLVTSVTGRSTKLLSRSLQALEFLKSDEYLTEVEKQMVEVRRKGVTGVPFVVIDGKWAVSGGQSAETYVQVVLFISLFRVSCR